MKRREKMGLVLRIIAALIVLIMVSGIIFGR